MRLPRLNGVFKLFLSPSLMLNDRVDLFPALQLSRRVVAVEGALAGVKARTGCLRVRPRGLLPPPSDPASFSLVYEHSTDDLNSPASCQPAPLRVSHVSVLSTPSIIITARPPPLRRPSHCPQRHSTAAHTPAPAEMLTNSAPTTFTHPPRSSQCCPGAYSSFDTPAVIVSRTRCASYYAWRIAESSNPSDATPPPHAPVPHLRHPPSLSFDAPRHPYFSDSPYATSRATPVTSRAGTYRTSRSVSLDTPRPLCSPSANRACRSSHVPRPWTSFATNTTHICIAAACSSPRLARARGLRPGTGRNLEDRPRIAAAILFVPPALLPDSLRFFSRFLCAPAAATGVWNTALEFTYRDRLWGLVSDAAFKLDCVPRGGGIFWYRGEDTTREGELWTAASSGAGWARNAALRGSEGRLTSSWQLHPLAVRAPLLLRFFVVEAARRRLSSPSGPPPDNLSVRPAGRDSEGGRPLEETGHTVRIYQSRNSASASSHKRFFRTSCFSLTRRCPTMRYGEAYWGCEGNLSTVGNCIQRIGRQGGAPVPICDASFHAIVHRACAVTTRFVEVAKCTLQTLEQEKGLLRQELVAHQGHPQVEEAARYCRSEQSDPSLNVEQECQCLEARHLARDRRATRRGVTELAVTCEMLELAKEAALKSESVMANCAKNTRDAKIEKQKPQMHQEKRKQSVDHGWIWSCGSPGSTLIGFRSCW
ncbi:hypothetical protein C8J57DRAFT_1659940 [Mycena rebaudengoi]|nr:hypothetical protein C8J57DRAFT_1659940 [Mycena rebaudengoi]